MYEITYLNIDENTEYEKTVKKVLEKCFEEEGLMDSKLIITVTFTNPEEIRKINKKYRFCISKIFFICMFVYFLCLL